MPDTALADLQQLRLAPNRGEGVDTETATAQANRIQTRRFVHTASRDIERLQRRGGHLRVPKSGAFLRR